MPFDTEQKTAEFQAVARAIDAVAMELLALGASSEPLDTVQARLDLLGEQLRALSADLSTNIAAGAARHLGMRDALAVSERQFRTVAENLPHHLARHHADGSYVYVNPKLEAFLGTAAADVIGKRPTQLFSGEGYSAYECMVLETARTGRPQIKELRFVTGDGQQVFHEIQCVAEIGEAGAVASVLALGYDITERKRTELAHKKALDLAEGVIAAIPDVLFEVDGDGRYLNVWTKNPASLARPAKELIGRSVLEVLPPTQATAAMHAIREASEHGVTYGHTIAVDLPDGDRRWFEHSVAKKPGDSPAADTFLVLSRDITVRRQVEQALNATHAKLLGVLQAIPDMVWLKDTEGVFVLCNHGLEQLVGKPASAIVGKTDYDFFDAELAGFFREKDKAAMEAGRVCINEEWIAAPHTGEPALFETRKVPVCDADGRVTGVLGVARDITERDRIEKTLAAREREFRTLAENLPMSIARYDRSGRRIYVNPRFEGDADPLVPDLSGGEGDTRCATPSAADQLLDGVMKVMSSGIPTELEICLTRVREPTWHSVRIAPEFGPDGEVVSALAICSDISVHKRMERALRALLNRRDTDLEEERRRIARELHDELGQQLVGLRMNLKLLSIQFGGNEPQLREATGRMLALVDTTIQTTRDVSSSLRPPVLDMGLIPSLEWLTATFSRHTGVHCDLRVPSGEVDMTEEQLVTIFRIAQESLTNAAKHSKAATIEIAFRRDSESFVLEVTDNGRGFETWNRQKLNTFGLVGMRERALAVGGELAIESARRLGTTIRVRIPVGTTSGAAQFKDDAPPAPADRNE